MLHLKRQIRDLGVSVLKSIKKRGDIQMMETMMVALVFVVVLLVALVFYFKFSLRGVEEAGEDACLVSSTVLLSSLSSMPEIQCSLHGNREQCIDTVKLLVFDATREYEEFFTANCPQRVSFVQLSPVPGDSTLECVQGTYPECAVYTFYDPDVEYRSSLVLSTPVSLYFPLTGEYRFGRLVVEVLQ